MTWLRGKLSASFDIKNVLLVSRVLFAAGTALTAAAPTMNAFIVGKTLTGVGSSGTYISIINIITAFTSGPEQGRYFGYIGFTWGLGTILGPPIGGAFAVSPAGWRWSFYFNLILVGVTFPVFLFLLPSRTKASAGLWTRVRHIDIVGSVLFAGALCTGVMALSFGGALYPWGSGPTITLFCLSGILSIVFVIQQATATFTTVADRILPIQILHPRSWEMWILIIQTGSAIGVLFITIFYIPLYFQFIRGESAIRSAVDLLPFLFTAVSAMLISGRLITYGYYKYWFIGGSSLTLIMSVCLYTTEITTSHGKIYGYLVLGGIGLGSYAMNSGAIMAAVVAKEHVADASTIFGSVDTLCSSISVAVANSIFVNRATDAIQGILPDAPRAVVQEAIAGVGASLTDQLPPPLKLAVLQAALDAIKDAYIQMIATAALSLILSLCLRNRSLDEARKG